MVRFTPSAASGGLEPKPTETHRHWCFEMSLAPPNRLLKLGRKNESGYLGEAYGNNGSGCAAGSIGGSQRSNWCSPRASLFIALLRTVPRPVFERDASNCWRSW